MRGRLEVAFEFETPKGFRLPPLGGKSLAPRAFTSVYYDLPDRSLANAGLTLCRRTERGRAVWQLELPGRKSRLRLERAGGRVTPPAELARLLQAHLRKGPLEPRTRLRTRRRGRLVARDGTTAEVTVDRVAVAGARNAGRELVVVAAEVRSGSESGLDALAAELIEAGARRTDGVPGALRRLRGRDAEEAATPDSPFEALRALLRRQLAEIYANDPGTRLGRDPESLRRLRGAVRRTRALLRAGRKLVRTDTTDLSDRLGDLGNVLGAVRDLDVLLARLRAEAAELDGDRLEGEALVRALAEERSRARRKLLSTLESAAYLSLLDDFERALDEFAPSGTPVSLDDLADTAAKKLRKAVEALPEAPSADALHELRKIGKRARYAAELAGHDEVVRRAKRLQAVLGAHQDAVVAEEWLRGLAAPPLDGGARVARRLLERERERRAHARTAWPEAWQSLREVT